jgi:hypothetical protein
MPESEKEYKTSKRKREKNKATYDKAKETYNNVEYLRILQGGRELLLLEGDQVNGKSRTEIEKYIGEKLGAGSYRYAIKYFGKANKGSGGICAVGVSSNDRKQLPQGNDLRIDKIESTLEQLAQNMSKGAGFDIDLLLKMKDESWKIKEQYYEMVIKNQKEEIEQLKKEFDNIDSNGDGEISITEIVKLLLQGMAQKQTIKP